MRTWTIYRNAHGEWTLKATLGRVDPYALRQRPLLFTSPRTGGYWCWPIDQIQTDQLNLLARLGPPEQ